MTYAKQPHYLPKKAHLSFFESPNNPGKVYLYQRSKEAVLISVERAARERNLYVFPSLEEVFTIVENAAQPVIEKIHSSRASFELTRQEYADLALFVACQTVRTPAFIADREQVSEQLTRGIAKFIAENKQAFASIVEGARNQYPEAFKRKVDLEKVRQSFTSGMYPLEPNREHFVVEAAKLIEPLWETLLAKAPRILRTDKELFITSDYPVSRLRDARGLPAFGAGFLQSTIMVPLGSCSLLLLENPARAFSFDEDSRVKIRVQRIRPAEARRLTRITMVDAEKYLFASFKSEQIERLFSQTKPKARFTVSHAFPGTGRS